jgi:hypothetical protein
MIAESTTADPPRPEPTGKSEERYKSKPNSGLINLNKELIRDILG